MRSIRRSVIIIIAAAIVIIILWVPFISDGIEDVLSDSGSFTSTSSFYNKDFLGLTNTDRITLSCDSESYVYLVSEEYYKLYSGNIDQLRYFRINTNDYFLDPTASFDFPGSKYGKYYLVVDYRYSSSDVVEYTFHQNISQTFINFVPMLMIFFIVVNAVWIVYLYSTREKYAAKAIYK